jgi:hypothetical protein
MSHGPFHNLRCKDVIAAAMLDDTDDRRRPEPATPDEATESICEVDADTRTETDRDTDGTPAFLADTDDEGPTERDVTVLTGPAGDGLGSDTTDR